MYDSRSRHNRSRNPKGYYSRPLVDTKQAEINEGLLDHAEVAEEPPMAHWEYVVSGEMDRLHEQALIEDWERTEEEAAFWESEANEVARLEAEAEWDDDLYNESNFLAGVSWYEACEMMPGGFSVTGPAKPTVSRMDYYVRVYQLARDLNVECEDLIALLRLEGEYVKTHQSLVAKPVAARMMARREEIVARLGERKAKKQTVAQLVDEMRAKVMEHDFILGPVGTARGYHARSLTPAPRPGLRPAYGAFASTRTYAPRPGANPFTNA